MIMQNRNKFYPIICVLMLLLFFVSATYGQTFKDTRVINTHSSETLKAGNLDIRIAHRFGDLLGTNGGWPTFYGLENVADVMIGAEYGISDKFMIGLNRTKGVGPLKQLVNGFAKYQLVGANTDDGIDMTLLLLASGSTMSKSTNTDLLNSFPESIHRMSYHSQIILAKRFSSNFSLQIHGSYTHRNLVNENDENGIISAGFASRINVNKWLGLIIDLNYPFSALRTEENGYHPSLGLGFEFETGGGHIFQLNFTNSQAIIETDYIPNTTSNWFDGQFRMGFTISRLFNI